MDVLFVRPKVHHFLLFGKLQNILWLKFSFFCYVMWRWEKKSWVLLFTMKKHKIQVFMFFMIFVFSWLSIFFWVKSIYLKLVFSCHFQFSILLLQTISRSNMRYTIELWITTEKKTKYRKCFRLRFSSSMEFKYTHNTSTKYKENTSSLGIFGKGFSWEKKGHCIYAFIELKGNQLWMYVAHMRIIIKIKYWIDTE